MKIGNNSYMANVCDTLMKRMEEAHADAKINDTEKSLAPHEALFAAGATSSGVEEPSPLETRLLSLAQDVLESRVQSTTEVRARVVEAIVAEKYDNCIPADSREQIVGTLKAALVNDPTFSEEVDNMLVLAAQQLGARSTAS